MVRSVRGTGTSGYTQRNRAIPEQQEPDVQQQEEIRHPRDPRIVAHERARFIESQLYDLRLSLESEGAPEDQIEAAITKKREQLQFARAPKLGQEAEMLDY